MVHKAVAEVLICCCAGIIADIHCFVEGITGFGDIMLYAFGGMLQHECVVSSTYDASFAQVTHPVVWPSLVLSKLI